MVSFTLIHEKKQQIYTSWMQIIKPANNGGTEL